MTPPINRSLALPPNHSMPSPVAKSGICLHHTVGGSARSTVDWWLRDNKTVATAYLIDRDGTIYEMFPPEHWAWQFGLKNPEWSNAERLLFEQRHIGIEIASEGGLTESDGQLYCFDVVSRRTWFSRAKAYDHGSPYRGYRYFARYTEEQMSSVVALVNHLCDRFEIERTIPLGYKDYYGRRLRDFRGVIGHVNVRLDKSDPLPDDRFWRQVIDGCRLTPADIEPPLAGSTHFATRGGRSDDRLFEANVQQINQMFVAAGSLVKQLSLELEKEGRDTSIRLFDAEPGGHGVSYEVVEGDADLVVRIATALGFKSATDTRLVVHG